ncbi:MAG TPA: hypothetical protein VN705_19020 [Steroidobacteraceae bacterium]|jgi:hypothetical protein|nr:hypothetical protein [Steroidobacteraceae bacterium]
MKSSASTRLYSLLLAAVLPLLDASAAGAPGVVEGTITRVTTDEVQVDHSRVYQFNPALARCFDFRGDALTCDTLVGIGYVDRARITLLGTAVQRIDILELQQ